MRSDALQARDSPRPTFLPRASRRCWGGCIGVRRQLLCLRVGCPPLGLSRQLHPPRGLSLKMSGTFNTRVMVLGAAASVGVGVAVIYYRRRSTASTNAARATTDEEVALAALAPPPPITKVELSMHFGTFGGRFNDNASICIVSFPARHHSEWNRVVLSSEKEVNVACVWLGESRAEEWQQLWVQNVQEAVEEQNRLVVVSPLDERYSNGQAWEIDWLTTHGLTFEVVALRALASLCKLDEPQPQRARAASGAPDGAGDAGGGASQTPTFMHVAMHPQAMLASAMASTLDYRQMVAEVHRSVSNPTGRPVCAPVRAPVCADRGMASSYRHSCTRISLRAVRGCASASRFASATPAFPA